MFRIITLIAVTVLVSRVQGNVNPSGFGYQVSLRLTGNIQFCAGVLVSDRYVLTAGRCVVGKPPSSIIAVIGTNNRMIGGVSYSISKIEVHNKFNLTAQENDIAALKTSVKVQFTSQVYPIRICPKYIGGGQHVKFSGYTSSLNPGSAGESLQTRNLTTITDWTCKSKLSSISGTNVNIADTICAVPVVGQDESCVRSNGGPLVRNNELVGIFVWSTGCGPDFLAGFAELFAYQKWIHTTTELEVLWIL